MTKVTIYKNEKEECVGFKAFGHAGYAEEGEDIICAALSVLMINTINAIEVFSENDATLESDDEQGLIDYRLTERPTKDTTLLLNAMILGLEDMADNEDYEKYIDLKFEEV